MKIVGSFILTVALVVGIAVGPGHATNPAVFRAEDPLIPVPDNVWIRGTEVTLVDTKQCWTADATPYLQVKRNGKYVTVARGILENTDCTKGFPYEASYMFTLKDGGGGKKLAVRSTDKRGGNAYFLRTVYSSMTDYNATAASFVDMFMDALTAPNTGALGGTGSSSPGASSGWSGCYFNGKPMWGNVKIVTFGAADFTVRRTTMLADLKVKPVDFLATSCGEWKFVEFGPADFTVRFTDLGPADFSVQFTDFLPGR